MSADLRDRMHEAVGDPTPRTVDLDQAWHSGRRRRHARQALGATAAVSLLVAGVVAVVQLPLGSNPDVAGRPNVGSEPVVDLEPAEGWVRLAAGRGHTLGDIGPAIDDTAEIEDIVTLEGAADWPWRPVWDVAEDGTVRWLDAGDHRVHQRAPDGTVTSGERLSGLYDQDGFAFVTALQIGPGGRSYLTGPSSEATEPMVDRTQVMIVDADGTVLSRRDNDPGLLGGMLFADGYGWQRHDPDTNWWQPIVDVGESEVLPESDQRRLEHRGELDPDGIRLEIGGNQDPEQESRYVLRTRRGELRWQLDMPGELNGWAAEASNRRAGQRLLVLDGTGATDSFVLRFDPAGFADAVRVDTGVAPGLEGIPDATAVLGADGYLYWPEARAGGDIAIVRYIHAFARDEAATG